MPWWLPCRRRSELQDFSGAADADEHFNGYRRQGALASFISFLAKAAVTLSAILGGFAPRITGFDGNLVMQPERALFAMKAVYIIRDQSSPDGKIGSISPQNSPVLNKKSDF